MNRCDLIGHLGSDPEIRKLQGGETVANVRIATTERWRDKQSGEKRERTEWHSLTMWGHLAELADKYLKKGSFVRVSGKLQTRKWEKDGQNHYSTEIVVTDLQFLDKKPAENSEAA